MDPCFEECHEFAMKLYDGNDYSSDEWRFANWAFHQCMEQDDCGEA